MISKFFVVFIFFSVGCSAPKYLVHNKSNNNNKELILITPTQEVKSKDNSTAIHLINKAGDVLKEWTVKLTALNSKMDSEGNLYVLGDKEKIEKLTNGIYRYFQIISPDNKVIWEYFNENLHHDFKLLPNGNILFLAYSPNSSKLLGSKVKDKDLYKDKVWTEKIIEINPKSNQIVWEWDSHKYIKISELPYISSRGDIFHANSIDYIDNYYLNNRPVVMFSARSISKVYIIDYESKKILWSSPYKLFSFQHDATFLGPSSILVFNNKMRSSEVIEYDLKKKKTVWIYRGGLGAFDQVQFFSSVVSGAQRLKNGNTFITLGTRSYMLEVTPDKKRIWSGFNSLNETNDDTGWPYKSIFKARQYPTPPFLD